FLLFRLLRLYVSDLVGLAVHFSSELDPFTDIHDNADLELGSLQYVYESRRVDRIQMLVRGNDNDHPLVHEQDGAPLPEDRSLVVELDRMVLRNLGVVLTQFMGESVLIEVLRQTAAQFAVHPVYCIEDLASDVEV